MMPAFRRLLSSVPPRILRTAAVAAVALLVVGVIWHDYLYNPWTRDGRVNAEVVKVAPEISDNIVELPVVDNQPVKKGDVVAVIDPARYKFLLDQAEAKLANRKQILDERILEAARRGRLVESNAVSVEEKQVADTALIEARTGYDEAVAARNLAQLDLERTVIRSPANGWIVNLHTRVGDYATPGEPLLSVLDRDSFWIAAYLEETKLAHVREGSRADIRLMGIGPKLVGHVESLSGGIQDENQANFTGFAAVNPIFTWVRLAQRIPIRVHIDHVPPGVRVVAGQTCSVWIKPGKS
jgi:multidrug resistance efflux pump